jgi:hypothetical protein
MLMHDLSAIPISSVISAVWARHADRGCSPVSAGWCTALDPRLPSLPASCRHLSEIAYAHQVVALPEPAPDAAPKRRDEPLPDKPGFTRRASQGNPSPFSGRRMLRPLVQIVLVRRYNHCAGPSSKRRPWRFDRHHDPGSITPRSKPSVEPKMPQLPRREGLRRPWERAAPSSPRPLRFACFPRPSTACSTASS